MARGLLAAILTLPVLMVAAPGAAQQPAITLPNQGGAMEGHTPRGFRGMGTGLFVGDNFNPRFPNGDGVQVFLTFDVSALPPGPLGSAELRSEHVHVRGTPFRDLGALRADRVRYERFSPDLWDQPDLGEACVLAQAAGEAVACDVTEAVRQALDEGEPTVQFRLRLDQPGDSDGAPDMVMFFISDANTNQPGIFTLQLDR